MRSVGDANPKAEGRRPKEGRAPKAKERLASEETVADLRVCRSSDTSAKQTKRSSFRASSLDLRPSTLKILLGLTCLLTTLCSSWAQSLPDSTLTQIRFDQKLNVQISPDLAFVDESGKPVRLRQYFRSKPVVVVLGYYECPMLCTLVLNGFMEGAEDMKWSIGREFDVVSVSINPRETPALAAAKHRAYVRRYGRAGSAQGWHFLTGNEPQIRELADEVGFRYAYDPASKEYAHPSGIVILTPEGKVSSYLFGITFPARDLFAGLERASVHKVSSPIQQLLLLCFHYNPITGKYSGLILIVLRIFGAFTMLGVLALIIVLVRRGRAAEACLRAAAQVTGVAIEPAGSMKSK